MPKNKKKFIDKKNSVTFQLVHRSQRDPLVTDETAPQHVLVEAGSQPQNKIDIEKRRDELKKFGVFFDDDYDYLQHLRESDKDVVTWEKVEPIRKNETTDKYEETQKIPSLQLPSSVFASKYEEKEGLLQKAVPKFGPRPDWDPDIVAALDEDFDFDDPDNELDDNFMEMAMNTNNAIDEDDEDDKYDSDNDADCDSNDLNYSDEEQDELGPLNYKNFTDEETKSKFTEYSMSSSVIRRNEQLTLLDDRFEKFFDQYDDNEIGALDCEDIDGHIDLQDELLINYAIQFKRDQTLDTYDKNWDTERILKCQEHSSTEDLVEIQIKDDTKKWDCESILSTYSNLYNHPKLIQEPNRQTIQINPKTGIPLNVLDGDNGKLTAKSLAQLNTHNPINNKTGPKSLCAQSVLSTLSVLSIRPKDETLEEKRERKKLLKEYRFERRAERKANSVAFTQEKKRQEKMMANNRLNIQGKKIN